MTTQLITLDESEKAYTAADLREPTLKTGQTYKWRVIGFESRRSQAGNPMGVITIAPLTSSGKALTQFSQRVFVTVPTNKLGEKVFKFARDRYFSVLQSFCAPQFNAFSKIERTETGTIYYGKDGNQLKGKARETARETVRVEMMDGRDAFLAGELVAVGQEAYAAFKAPREGSEYPEIGSFTQDVSENSSLPFADEFKEMIG